MSAAQSKFNEVILALTVALFTDQPEAGVNLTYTGIFLIAGHAIVLNRHSNQNYNDTHIFYSQVWAISNTFALILCHFRIFYISCRDIRGHQFVFLCVYVLSSWLRLQS